MRKSAIFVAIATMLAPFLLASPAWAQAGRGSAVRGMRAASSAVAHASRASRGVRAGASAVSRVSRSAGGVGAMGRASGVRVNVPRGVSQGRMPGRADLAAQAVRRGPSGSPVHGRGGRYGVPGEGYNMPRGGYQGLIDPSLLSELARYYNLPQGGAGYSYDDLYRHLGYQDRASKDYRDASIANAIAGMVGMIAATAMQQQSYAGPPAAAPMAQAPVAAGPVYERHQVVVQEGRNEKVEVWVPERYDPATETTVEGHYEVHQRWVPPVFETREIRVR